MLQKLKCSVLSSLVFFVLSGTAVFAADLGLTCELRAEVAVEAMSSRQSGIDYQTALEQCTVKEAVVNYSELVQQIYSVAYTADVIKDTLQAENLIQLFTSLQSQQCSAEQRYLALNIQTSNISTLALQDK
jgi:hypothetical protein